MNKSFCRLQILSFLLLILLSAPGVSAYSPPDIPTTEPLYTVETPHFAFVYQKSVASVVPEVAQYCEEAYFTLVDIFGWEISDKIPVLVMDSMDTHNGWSTSVPHNKIAVFVAGSEQQSSLYQPGSYLKRTVYHELTHTITTDMRYGYNKLLSSIFGKIEPLGDPLSFAGFLFTSSPVLLSPRWYLEGQSIWAESVFTPPGRGRSAYAEMIFRTAVKDNTLLPAGKWYVEQPDWPYGSAAYLYGMRLLHYISQTSDNPLIQGELTNAIARSFLFNSSHAARRVTGKTFAQLAREMLDHEHRFQNKNLKKLNRLAVTATPRLTQKDIIAGPMDYAAGKIFFLAKEKDQGNSVYSYDLQTKNLRRYTTAKTTSPMGSITISKSGSIVYYTRLNYQEKENLWYEIRKIDPGTGQDSLVAKEGRYSDIALSPDEKHLIAVRQKAGTPMLVELNLHEEEYTGETLLLKGEMLTDIASPSYSPDGNRIAFILAEEKSCRLLIYNRTKKTFHTHFRTPHRLLFPAWHPRSHTLVFIHDANGVFNCYQLDINTGDTTFLTNVTGGLFYPVFHEDGRDILAVGFDGFGPHLTKFPYDPASFRGQTLPSIEFLSLQTGVESALSDIQNKARQSARKSLEETTSSRKYYSAGHLRFDYWTPWLTASSRGVQGGFAASFSDPSGYQDITLLLGMESEYSTKIGGLHGHYRGLGPDFHGYVSADQEYYSDLVVTEDGEERFDYAEEVYRYGLAVDFPLLLDIDYQLFWSLGYEYKQRHVIDEVKEEYEGRDLSLEPTEDSQAIVWSQLTYFDGSTYERSSSVEDGRLISLGAEWADQKFGGDINRTRYLGEWDEYLPVRGLDNHVLKLTATYGVSFGDRTAQGAFGLGGMAGPVSQLTPGIPNTLTLRGYDPNFQTGDRVVKTAAAYRLPIWDISKGVEGSFPFYSRQIFAEIFYEGGRTWDDEGEGDDLEWIHSTGLEVSYSMKMLRYLAFAPTLGVAYAPDRDRRDEDESEIQPYLSIKAWINF